MASPDSKLRGFDLIRRAIGMFWREKRDASLILGTFAFVLAVIGQVSDAGSVGGTEGGIAAVSYVWFNRFHQGAWSAKFEVQKFLYLYWTRLKLIVPMGVPMIVYAVLLHEKTLAVLDVGLLVTWLTIAFWLYQRCSLCFPTIVLKRRMKLRESFKLTRGHDRALLIAGSAILAVILINLIALLIIVNPFAHFFANVLGTFSITALAYGVNSELYRYFEDKIDVAD
jgi:hypothetical protein